MKSVTITKRDIRRKQRDGGLVTLPRYVVHYVDPKTNKKSDRFFERKKDAEQCQRELLVAFEQGTYAIAKDVPTIKEAFGYWVKDREGEVKPSTLEGYKKYEPYVVGPLLTGDTKDRFHHTFTGEIPEGQQLLTMLGAYKIYDLSTAEIRLWHKQLTEHVGIYTANRAKQHLGTVLSLAAEDFDVRTPVIPRRLGKGRRKEKKAILTTGQVNLLLEAAKADQKYGIYYAFPFLAGTRPSEQLGLLWREVDFERRIIHICRIQERTGGLTETTKTEAGNREIPMSNILYEMLLEWREKCPRKNCELYRVFPGHGARRKFPLPPHSPGGELSYSNFRKRVWNKALERLKLPHVTPHSARHCFISTLQAQGVEVGLVAKLAGHASAVVTLGHYTQAVRGGEQAVEALARAYSRTL